MTGLEEETAKVAVTLRAAVIETVHVVPLPVHAPLHPEKIYPLLGDSVSVTEVPDV